jgi:hypothetical protein
MKETGYFPLPSSSFAYPQFSNRNVLQSYRCLPIYIFNFSKKGW